ncbi:TIM barrel protein [Streptomyces echinatus]|uniref:TIM barrel protein n=1 Tax=Streptomyces echinatus TaxID=67293 RepID=UPI0031E71E4A
MCRLARDFGYDGLELACWGDHFEGRQGARRPGYLASRHQLLDSYGLKCWAISNHLVGQAVCDAIIDERHQAILPGDIWADGDPEGRTAPRRGADQGHRPRGRRLRRRHRHRLHRLRDLAPGRHVPAAPESMIERGYEDFAERWNPILDVFDTEGVRFAHEVHPSEIAYDYWTTQRALDAVDHGPPSG